VESVAFEVLGFFGGRCVLLVALVFREGANR
jgi:hypothetical protein